jgi:hypothetical protein
LVFPVEHFFSKKVAIFKSLTLILISVTTVAADTRSSDSINSESEPARVNTINRSIASAIYIVFHELTSNEDSIFFEFLRSNSFFWVDV